MPDDILRRSRRSRYFTWILGGTLLVVTSAATADVVVTSGTLQIEDDNGGVFYDESVTAEPVSLWGDIAWVEWSGTAADPLRIEGGGGDWWESHDSSDMGSWEYWGYGYIDLNITVQFESATLLTGSGDLGFQMTSLGTGDTWDGPLSSIAGGLIVEAGLYQVHVADWGYGVHDSGGDYWEDPDTGEYSYDSWTSYSYSGWLEITEVPAPAALALLGLAGLASPRRRR